eukprot:Awhi_evm1s87
MLLDLDDKEFEERRNQLTERNVSLKHHTAGKVGGKKDAYKPEALNNCQMLLDLDDKEFEERRNQLTEINVSLKHHTAGKVGGKKDAYKPEALNNCQMLLDLDDKEFEERQNQLTERNVSLKHHTGGQRRREELEKKAETLEGMARKQWDLTEVELQDVLEEIFRLRYSLADFLYPLMQGRNVCQPSTGRPCFTCQESEIYSLTRTDGSYIFKCRLCRHNGINAFRTKDGKPFQKRPPPDDRSLGKVEHKTSQQILYYRIRSTKSIDSPRHPLKITAFTIWLKENSTLKASKSVKYHTAKEFEEETDAKKKRTWLTYNQAESIIKDYEAKLQTLFEDYSA